MALKWNYQSTSTTAAAYATGWRDMQRTGSATALLLTSGGTGTFGGSYLDVTSTPVVIWGGADNCPVGSAAVSICWRLIPINSGNPSANVGLISYGNGNIGNAYGGLGAFINTSGKLVILAGSTPTGANYFPDSVFGTAITFVAGVAIDIWFIWDGSTTANAAQCWTAANGTQATKLASITAGAAAVNCIRGAVPEITNYDIYDGIKNNLMHINEIGIFDSYETPSSYGARTQFLAQALSLTVPFEGYGQTDPGIANVRNGTNYTIQGVPLTGTAVIPTAAQTEHGVVFDGGQTGTYRGADLWSDPGIANVVSGTNYNANGVGLTGTFVCPASVDPGIANVVAGVNYTISGAAKTGTYVPPASIDPGVANVRLATAYEIAGAAKVGTLIMPTAAQVEHDVVFDATTVGTYRGADLWTDPGIANVGQGVNYTANGVTLTGTAALQPPLNTFGVSPDGKDSFLDQRDGNIPDMSETLANYLVQMTFTKVTKTVQGYELVETQNPIPFEGCQQPYKPTELEMEKAGERAWQWVMLHATTDLKLADDDIFTLNDGKNYRVMSVSPYGDYGFVSYKIIVDYQ